MVRLYSDATGLEAKPASEVSRGFWGIPRDGLLKPQCIGGIPIRKADRNHISVILCFQIGCTPDEFFFFFFFLFTPFPHYYFRNKNIVSGRICSMGEQHCFVQQPKTYNIFL